MLSSLYIENIAVVERAEVRFGNGFHVLTGETGAGKSVILSSIFMLSGERISRDMIRKGASSAVAIAEITDISDGTKEKLSALQIFPDEEGKIILSREITTEGKSSCRINSRPIGVSILKQAGGLLFSIHGQNKNTELLNPDNHLPMLDAFAGNKDALKEYEALFDETAKLRKELLSLMKQSEEKEEREEFLSHSIEELKAADFKENEDEELLKRAKFLSGGEKILIAVSEAASLVYEGNDEAPSAYDLLSNALSAITQAESYSSDLKTIRENLSEVFYSLESVKDDLCDFKGKIAFDPEEITFINERLDMLSSLKRKHKATNASELLSLLEGYEKELFELQNSEVTLSTLNERYEASLEQMRTQAKKLTILRENAAKDLEKRLKEELLELDMPNILFKIEISPEISGDGKKRLTRTGRDKVRFLISPNKGEDLKELSKTASGGELSRIMLALENILHSTFAETLIFDEIDSGVSGRAAGKMAKKLYDISSEKQVICVSHLAQIASFADVHFLIEKEEKDGRTVTNIEKLSDDGREKELARIISGINITELTLKNAREMLKLAESQKNYSRGVLTNGRF